LECPYIRALYSLRLVNAVVSLELDESLGTFRRPGPIDVGMKHLPYERMREYRYSLIYRVERLEHALRGICRKSAQNQVTFQ